MRIAVRQIDLHLPGSGGQARGMVESTRVDGRSGIDAALVRRLVASQFPEWSHLSVTPVKADGWDNRTYHLGDDMTVRLPSGEGYAAAVAKEQRWLPFLAPHLPLPIPEPLGLGTPAEGCPHHWSVYRWLDGETASVGNVEDLSEFARTLADFLTSLKNIDPTDGPAAGPHSFFRGGPLTTYDAETRRAVNTLGDRIDGDRALAVWDAALAAAWRGQPVWFHGDVAVGNLLVREGRLAAVIDFGTSGVGDPACDLVIAWTFLSGESRETFRAAIDTDPATWARGRGWALWKSLIGLAGRLDTDPAAGPDRRIVDDVIAEHEVAPGRRTIRVPSHRGS